jgi:ACS family allantoate permease-like MFS transporter
MPLRPPNIRVSSMSQFFVVLSVFLGVTLAAQRYIGRGYAAALIFAPALLGAILVNTLPSHNKVGLLFSYWVSIFMFTPFAILLGWVPSIVSGHTKCWSIHGYGWNGS